MIALCPKRSKKISPGAIVTTPIRIPGSCAWAMPIAAINTPSSSQPCRSRFSGELLLSIALERQELAAEAAPTGESGLAMHAHVQGMQPPRIGARDPEAETAQGQLLAGFRQVADCRGHQATNRVVFVVVEVRAEALVEVADRGECIDRVLAVGLRGDQRRGIVGLVMLVIDLADDLLQHVLDR